MAAIDKAVSELKSQGSTVKGQLKEVAEKYGVDRSTLGRRVRGKTGSVSQGYNKQQKLSPQQELELVKYIEDLTGEGLPPTRQMI
jgi:transcriptional regulator with XRE-family HTH domain